jgi:hypothetical protein
MNRRPAMIMIPVLFLTAFLWTVEAWGRAQDRGWSHSPRTHPAAVAPPAGVLCGCTHVLKNFS